MHFPGIRHPEELSLARKLDSKELKKNQGISATRRHRLQGVQSPNNHNVSSNGLDGTLPGSPSRMSPYSPATPQVGIVQIRYSKTCCMFIHSF